MKIYNLTQLADLNQNAEYCLFAGDVGVGLSLSYNRIRPGEAGRKAPPSSGEEIFCVIKGVLSIRQGRSSFKVSAGEAFIPGPQPLIIDNDGAEEAAYIITCGGQAASSKKEAQPATASGPAAETSIPDEADEFDIQRDDSAEIDPDAV